MIANLPTSRAHPTLSARKAAPGLTVGPWEHPAEILRTRDLSFFRACVVQALSSHNPKEGGKGPEFGSLRPLVCSERAGSLGGTHV